MARTGRLDLDEYARVHALATRALRIQAQIVNELPRDQLRWVRWHMTQAVLDKFAAIPVKVAGLTPYGETDGRPELFAIPITVIEQPDGEPAPWGLYLGVAA
jgi:hypothetical protein